MTVVRKIRINKGSQMKKEKQIRIYVFAFLLYNKI